MKNTIRCCISCILPCGALDVIRIVHTNGHVEEISGTIKAEEIMKLHPNHVLKKPSSPSDEGMYANIVVVPPDAILQRGKIYFLMPLPSRSHKTPARSSTRRKKKESESEDIPKNRDLSMKNLLVSDQYLSEILSEKLSTQRDRRRGRVGVWRPHLESISETTNDA
ncbi:uncharacterized protein LOC111412828 [Olea europaea var. sylvestris]|uniref:Uncharacterized protein n=1 Tax=Olea europaea subsp. europaea TaxID=158383 RepID=A0A8S0SXP9_OLEEU|nr:uncharacterized protein LOC111412828 [Olea europaea var. sylvestris]CAA2997029.1 Hypothetical predicted protein [Olea europaea subsp. europaea]